MKLYYNLTPAFKVFKQSFGSETIQYSNKQHFICVQNYCRHNRNWVNQAFKPWKWIKKFASYIPFWAWFFYFIQKQRIIVSGTYQLDILHISYFIGKTLSNWVFFQKCTTNLIESVQLLVIKNHEKCYWHSDTKCTTLYDNKGNSLCGVYSGAYPFTFYGDVRSLFVQKRWIKRNMLTIRIQS